MLQYPQCFLTRVGEMQSERIRAEPSAGTVLSPWLNVYLSQGLPLVLLHPCSKRPIPHPDTGRWWRLESLSDLNRVLLRYLHPNLAIIAVRIVQVDPDSPEALEWARQRGLISEGAWVLRTSRGLRLFYKAPDPCPATHTDPEHRTPDLLAPGRLAIVPPSIHPSGHRYVWAKGHSPADIPSSELAPLPEGILAAWHELKRPRPIQRPHRQAPGWLGLVFEAICHYLEASGHRLRPGRDGGITTTCPLHDDRNPSLSLHPERGWMCFSGCGEGRLTLLAARLGVRVREE